MMRIQKTENDAAKDAFLNTGLQDVSNYSQRRDLNANQQDMDALQWAALEKSMPALFSSGQFEQWADKYGYVKKEK